ncbi:CPBP family intramembrane metalloprotease [uncultured Lactobacillus sp.]|uniref:CPBP family intramembrane metalloprotease n=1 Tax=uncultured Lactobacillus sp. TaxID=153152 RepID=UPI0026147332|nr:CPBP family intramembrane metalloprotease [uncultured Lactobacillus sp.]
MHFVQLAILIALIGLNFLVQFKSKANKALSITVRWLNLVIFSSGFTSIWLQVGNFLLLNFKQLEVVWILLLWVVYLVLLLPSAVLFAGKIRNWFLALIAVNLLGCQDGPDASLLVSKNLLWMHSITTQGVIAAFALFNIACLLPKAWGYNFNPNLKFIKSQEFQNSVFIILLIFAAIDVFYNAFSDYNSNIWSLFFKYSASFEAKYFTIASFTSALEPAILEETMRYLCILILLAGFNRFKEYRVPIAIFGSAILFGLSHVGNIGWHGQSVQETIAQVIGVMGSGFLWAVLYLYSGKYGYR